MKLFQRRPFALTPAGRELYAFAEPFFGRLGQISRRLRSEEDTRLRLAAPATILRNHLPDLLRDHKRRYPDLTLRLYDANQATAERLLQAHEIDLAVTELEGKPAAGLNSTILFKLAPVLIVPKPIKQRAAAELWRAGTETLISLPADEVMVKQFHTHLRRRGAAWRTRIVVSALDLIPIYVELELGVGLSLAVPGMKLPRGMRALPLPGFPALVVAVLSQKNLNAPTAAFLEEIKRRARAIAKEALG